MYAILFPSCYVNV